MGASLDDPPPLLLHRRQLLKHICRTISSINRKSTRPHTHTHWGPSHRAHKLLTGHRDQLLHRKLLPVAKQVAVSHRLHMLEDRETEQWSEWSLDIIVEQLHVYLRKWVNALELMQDCLKKKGGVGRGHNILCKAFPADEFELWVPDVGGLWSVIADRSGPWGPTQVVHCQASHYRMSYNLSVKLKKNNFFFYLDVTILSISTNLLNYFNCTVTSDWGNSSLVYYCSWCGP